MWSIIKSWLGVAAKKLWEIVAPAVKQAAMDFVNNAEVQSAARAAVVAAASNGLKNNEAFDFAVEQLKSSAAVAGQGVAQKLLDTGVQNAYFAFKNAE